VVEAQDETALSSGARGLSIRVARALNRALERRGPVWGDRYHAHALKTPKETRNAVVYVLMNFKKHHPRTDVPSIPAHRPSGSMAFGRHLPSRPTRRPRGNRARGSPPSAGADTD